MIFLLTPHAVLVEVINAARLKIAREIGLPLEWVRLSLKGVKTEPVFDLDIIVEIGPTQREILLAPQGEEPVCDVDQRAVDAVVQRHCAWACMVGAERVRGVYT